jgi:hypothetical protein
VVVEEVSLGVIMTNTEIKFHILLFTLSSRSFSQSLSFNLLQSLYCHWRYDLGEDVYVIIKAPQLRIHIRKYFVPNGEWTLHLTKRGVTLSLYEWKELEKTIPLFEVFSQVISPVHEFSVFHSTDQIVHHLHSTAQDFPLW